MWFREFSNGKKLKIQLIRSAQVTLKNMSQRKGMCTIQTIKKQNYTVLYNFENKRCPVTTKEMRVMRIAH